MALALNDRVKETTTIVGTGTATLLGAALGYQSFAVIGNGNTTYYCIADQGGANWEVGLGTYTLSGTTLARTTVLSSSNAGALVNFSAGTKDVFVTYPSEKGVWLDDSGNAIGLGTPVALVGTNITGTASGLTAGNVTTNANLTGGVTSVGNAATVVTNANLTGMVTSVGNAASLGSFTSLQLATALTDETGTGSAVFSDNASLLNPTYTGTLTGSTGILNIGSGQVYKDASGNVGIGTASPTCLLDVGGTGAIKLPSGTSAQRPVSPVAGMTRYNSTLLGIETYNGTSWIAVQSSVGYTVSYLIAAGGGGGGGNSGGGGGAGGLVTSSTILSIGQLYTVSIGAGGAGTTANQTAATNGSTSSLIGMAVSLSTVGGGGGIGGTGGGTVAGNAGGSGGGGGPFSVGGAGTTGQGFAGGTGGDSGGTNHGSGGGGGSSAVGGNRSGSTGGAGGAGTSSSITGSSVAYAGGGGGAGGVTGASGTDGGGNGKGGAGNGNAGSVNTGGGGGGGGSSSGLGGTGGSGVVILSVPTSNYTGTTTGSPTITTSGTNTIIKFTASGSYTA